MRCELANTLFTLQLNNIYLCRKALELYSLCYAVSVETVCWSGIGKVVEKRRAVAFLAEVLLASPSFI